MFPSTANTYKNERLENPGYAAKEAKKILNKKALKESTKEALNIMNKSFEQTYGISFEESLLSNSSSFEKKLCYEEKRQIKNQHFREAVGKVDNDYEETLVDRVYGGRNSLRKHDRERKKQFFETVPCNYTYFGS
jgi:hypothetical protein